jgi:hypothetical protein
MERNFNDWTIRPIRWPAGAPWMEMDIDPQYGGREANTVTLHA